MTYDFIINFFFFRNNIYIYKLSLQCKFSTLKICYSRFKIGEFVENFFVGNFLYVVPCTTRVFLISSLNSLPVSTIGQNLHISKSIMGKFCFEGKIKVRFLKNVAPLCDVCPWRRHDSLYSWYTIVYGIS